MITSVSTEIAGLLPDTTYHFRVIAVNFSGAAHGPDQTFTHLLGATDCRRRFIVEYNFDQRSTIFDRQSGPQCHYLPFRLRSKRSLRV